MVLRGDEHLARGDLPHGLIGAPVTVLHLVRLTAHREGEELMSETDAEHGELARDLSDLFDDGGVFFGIAGPLASMMPSG